MSLAQWDLAALQSGCGVQVGGTRIGADLAVWGVVIVTAASLLSFKFLEG